MATESTPDPLPMAALIKSKTMQIGRAVAKLDSRRTATSDAEGRAAHTAEIQSARVAVEGVVALIDASEAHYAAREHLAQLIVTDFENVSVAVNALEDRIMWLEIGDRQRFADAMKALKVTVARLSMTLVVE